MGLHGVGVGVVQGAGVGVLGVCPALDLCPSTSMPIKIVWLPLAWLVGTATVTVTRVSVAQGHGLPGPYTSLYPLT